jgi:hypothetical protein
MDTTKYLRLLGSLRYLTKSRPDIVTAVFLCFHPLRYAHCRRLRRYAADRDSLRRCILLNTYGFLVPHRLLPVLWRHRLILFKVFEATPRRHFFHPCRNQSPLHVATHYSSRRYPGRQSTCRGPYHGHLHTRLTLQALHHVSGIHR